MTSIYKTAYPYYSDKKKISKEMIVTDYRLTHAEILDIRKRMPENVDSQLSYAVQLMVFKNLNYFPETTVIPNDIIQYIKDQLQVQNAKFNTCHPSTLMRYRARIYTYYNITPWKQSKKDNNGNIIYPAQKFLREIAIEASKTHNYPADIINIVVERMKEEKFELPTFNQLDRLVREVRANVNQELFDNTYASLTENQIAELDLLLKTTDDYQRSDYNALKAAPKNPTISHFRELLKHHDWLFSFGDINRHIKDIIPIKQKQFATQAKSLDASDLKDFAKPKRCTLILCLILQAQTQAKDALGVTFCRTLIGMHKKAREKLENMREFYRARTQELLAIFSDILEMISHDGDESSSKQELRAKADEHGGTDLLKIDCEQAIALHSNNYLPFLKDFFKGKRSILLRLLEILELHSSTQENTLINAIKIVLDNQSSKQEFIDVEIDLSFTTEQWKRLILKKEDKKHRFNRCYLELCVLSHVANELRTKDLFIIGSDSYADYRSELLPLEECAKILDVYCKKIGISINGAECVKQLREELISKAKMVDTLYPDTAELTIDGSGKMILHKRATKKRPGSAVWLEKMLKSRMKNRNLIDVLCSSHFYCGWADIFGPISGEDHKISDPIERYLLTSFAYATGLGPTQTALHVRGNVSAHMLSWVNRRHVTPEMLDKAREKLINLINQFKLVLSWGDGKSVAGDGTMQELREQSLIAEFHFRYRRMGGIAYHHVADNYILLFSTFMSCGVWEAVEIIEGLLKNNSTVQPDIIHGDTQAQSTIVFALSYLLGFKLMPRIRNWQDLKLFRPTKSSKYKHIDSLFSDTINWDIIERHWEDIMQVVLSIHEGKMSSSKLLRKLSNNSKKNRLYQAFQELGYVIRTLFLLDYISDVELRETITAQTNKVEAYNALSDWCAFGSDVLVASNDDIEMEKAVKYNDILANAVILQNVCDMSDIIAELMEEGYKTTKEDMSYLCPYWTSHLKRFGDIVMDIQSIPKNIERSRSLVLWQ
ncbi:MAG: Tn3 family transposase [Gammaproteobacteria bacterium]|nr:Tn3 family transposase [Gammaproteobacteria bacterium]